MLLRTVLRAASAWFIWRWLEPRWKSTLALVIGWLTVVLIHNEYVEYVQITDRTDLLWLSYFLKWITILTGILLWVWFSLLATQPRRVAEITKTRGRDTERQTPTTGDDGFDFLRQKPKLESRGDKLLHTALNSRKPRGTKKLSAERDDNGAPP